MPLWTRPFIHIYRTLGYKTFCSSRISVWTNLILLFTGTQWHFVKHNCFMFSCYTRIFQEHFLLCTVQVCVCVCVCIVCERGTAIELFHKCRTHSCAALVFSIPLVIQWLYGVLSTSSLKTGAGSSQGLGERNWIHFNKNQWLPAAVRTHISLAVASQGWQRASCLRSAVTRTSEWATSLGTLLPECNHCLFPACIGCIGWQKIKSFFFLYHAHCTCTPC